MSTDIALVIQFYWRDKLVETEGLFEYDPPRCKKGILVKHRISYDKLVDRVYTYMQLNWNVFKLNLWFRNFVNQSIFAGVQLGCKDDIDMLYHMNSMSSHTAYDIYVEMEPQNHHIHSDYDGR